MSYFVSKNSFELLVSKKKSSSKTCTVFSLTSGKIYSCPTSQIFNSKKGKVMMLRKNQTVNCEKTIYGRFKKQELKGVSSKTYNEMFALLKPVDSYTNVKIEKK